MGNQHSNIQGRRELNQEEINLINRINQMWPQLDALIIDVKELNASQANDCGLELYLTSKAEQWADTAETNLLQGLMALNRAVAKPDLF